MPQVSPTSPPRCGARRSVDDGLAHCYSWRSHSCVLRIPRLDRHQGETMKPRRLPRSEAEPKRIGWFEEYRCGCVSETEKHKSDLLGYCGRHGDSRRHIHQEIDWVLPTRRPPKGAKP